MPPIHPTTPNASPRTMATSFCPELLDLLVAAGDDVAEPVADEVADDAAGHGPEDVRSQPGRAAPGRRRRGGGADVLLAGVLGLADRGVNGHGSAPPSRESA